MKASGAICKAIDFQQTEFIRPKSQNNCLGLMSQCLLRSAGKQVKYPYPHTDIQHILRVRKLFYLSRDIFLLSQ